MFGLSRPSSDMEGAYAQDFLSRAVEADAVEGPDVQAVSAFFMRELGVPVAPIVLASSPMSRAMICLIDGERAAMVEYEMDGYTLAHYRVPLQDGRMPGRSPAVTDENGVCVYRWSDGRFEHALVSDMPEDRLLAIAEANFRSTSP
jgi:anti-sigma factor RsiW